MKDLVKIKELNAISLAEYKLNEYTTRHGSIIFDNSKAGNVSNSFMYRVGYEEYGHIDIYIDKEFKILNSIWFVSLKSKILYIDSSLNFIINKNFEIPFFDTSIWEEKEKDTWPRVHNESSIEIYHNGIDIVYITFGKRHIFCPLNRSIQIQYDRENCLTGILIKNESEIPKLLKLLKE